MIEGHVRTNVDSLQSKSFPVWFSPNIQVGHFVKASDGTEAKIVRITHASKDTKPYLIIEVWSDPRM
jgi:hypothetical protein